MQWSTRFGFEVKQCSSAQKLFVRDHMSSDIFLTDKDQVLITTVSNLNELPDISMNAGTNSWLRIWLPDLYLPNNII